MITQHDIEALVDLLNRTPLTKAEQLWAALLIEKLLALLPKGEA